MKLSVYRIFYRTWTTSYWPEAPTNVLVTGSTPKDAVKNLVSILAIGWDHFHVQDIDFVGDLFTNDNKE